jgi:hypothetical protein
MRHGLVDNGGLSEIHSVICTALGIVGAGGIARGIDGPRADHFVAFCR